VKRKKSSPRSLKQVGILPVNENANALHTSVLLSETLRFLEPERGGIFVDCTLGMGGHSQALLESAANASVVGIDRDPQAIEKASERLKGFGTRFRHAHADFREIKSVLKEIRETGVAGILADLGVSSWQLDQPERGFSFRFDAPLDMRMNTGSSREPTAAELLKELSEEEIANIIYEYGEERFSRRIARRIIEKRENGEPLETTDQLAELVAKAVKAGRHERIHPATKTFQALRIAVNRELENLDLFLQDAVDVLEPNGKLAVISFHSLEDRIVKKEFRKLAGVCECPPKLPICQCGAVRKVEILTNRPVVASEAEMQANPRARSAKLRVCRRLESE
jgi:16S rRNA (cytosine1402-N4)-methyltransferase